MIICKAILGTHYEQKKATTSVDNVEISWSEAGRRRLRRHTSYGRDLSISLERNQYLFHGAILFKDADLTVVVSRPKELTLVIDLASNLSSSDLIRQAAVIAHIFGNQHTPIEVTNYSIFAPMLTSKDLITKTLKELNLNGLTFYFDSIRLGSSYPLRMMGYAHG